MKLDIQSWIRIARRLGKHILEPSDIDTDSEIKIWRETYKSSEKVMKDLNDPHFFAQKAVDLLFRSAAHRGEPAAAGEPDPGGRHRRLRRSIHRNVPGQQWTPNL